PSPRPVRPRLAPAGRRAASTVVLKDGRTASMFRVVVKRRRRQTVPTSGRALVLGCAAAIVFAGATVLTMAPARRPPGAHSDASRKAPIVLRAGALEPARTRARDTLCRIVLSADGVSVSASATNKPLYEISYGQIVSVSYSHGIDPPTAARA